MSIEPTNSIVQIVLNYRAEAKQAKQNRMNLNAANFDCYQLKQNYGHKTKGQSREFLPKQAMAVEQLTSFIQQSLIDQQGDWYSIDIEEGVTDPILTNVEIKKILDRELKANSFATFVADSVKLGLLGALMICKVRGEMRTKVEFVSSFNDETDEPEIHRKEKDVWGLKLDLIRQQDFYPDPTTANLYDIHEFEIDFHELLEVAEANPKEYDIAAIKTLSTGTDFDQDSKKSRESGQNVPLSSSRKRIKITECWGTLIEPGTGKVLHKDSVTTIANDLFLIRKPTPYPFWHGRRTIIDHGVLRNPGSRWPKAMMDAPTMLNKALNELYNLMVDGGFMSVWGVRQIRTDWLVDPSQVANGIPAGEVLGVNSSAPPNAKVLERVDTGAVSSEAIQMFNLMDKEFQVASLTNDIRLGVLPQRKVKATEIVATQQTITGIFNGLVKLIEQEYVEKILELSWMTIAQNISKLDVSVLETLFGEERGQEIFAMSAEDLFAGSVNGIKFKVFGLSATLNKIQDFKKIVSLLQTMASSDVLGQAFQEKFSFTKLLDEIIKSLDIDTAKLLMDPNKQPVPTAAQRQTDAVDAQSQIPQVANQPEETGLASNNPNG